MADMTRKEYWDEIRAIRGSLLDDWLDERDEHNDADEFVCDRLHQDIDGHQWIIYTAYHLDVLRFSDNRDAYVDSFGEMPSGPDVDLDRVHCLFAFEAMRTDVMDGLEMSDFEAAA